MNWFMEIKWDFPAVVVALAGLWLTVVLVVWHRENSKFDLRHVLVDCDTERVSLHRLGQFVALVVSTMVLWYEMMHGRLTEWLFAGYMFTWTGALLAKRWLEKPPAAGAPAAPGEAK